jgi:hypothetical protein
MRFPLLPSLTSLSPSAIRASSLPVPGRRLVILALVGGLITLFAGPAQAGNLVNARCPCGFEAKRLPVFGGRRDFRTVCRFPGLCQATGRIVLINLLDPTHRPEDCPTGRVLSYAEPPLAPDPPGRVLLSWNISSRDLVVRLYEDGYFCPRCHRKTLRFFLAGFFD